MKMGRKLLHSLAGLDKELNQITMIKLTGRKEWRLQRIKIRLEFLMLTRMQELLLGHLPIISKGQTNIFTEWSGAGGY